jgi:hypothetical protein
MHVETQGSNPPDPEVGGPSTTPPSHVPESSRSDIKFNFTILATDHLLVTLKDDEMGLGFEDQVKTYRTSLSEALVRIEVSISNIHFVLEKDMLYVCISLSYILWLVFLWLFLELTLKLKF